MTTTKESTGSTSTEIEQRVAPGSAIDHVTSTLSLHEPSGDWRKTTTDETSAAQALVLAVIEDEKSELLSTSAPSQIEVISTRIERMTEATSGILAMVGRGDLPDLGEVYDMLDFLASGREDRRPPHLVTGVQDTAKIRLDQVRVVMARYAERGEYIHVSDLAAMQEVADATGLQLPDVDRLREVLSLDPRDDSDMEIVGQLVASVKPRDGEDKVDAIIRTSRNRMLGDTLDI